MSDESYCDMCDQVTDHPLPACPGKAASELPAPNCSVALTRDETNFLMWCVGVAEGRARSEESRDFVRSHCDAARAKLMSMTPAGKPSSAGYIIELSDIGPWIRNDIKLANGWWLRNDMSWTPFWDERAVWHSWESISVVRAALLRDWALKPNDVR